MEDSFTKLERKSMHLGLIVDSGGALENFKQKLIILEGLWL